MEEMFYLLVLLQNVFCNLKLVLFNFLRSDICKKVILYIFYRYFNEVSFFEIIWLALRGK